MTELIILCLKIFFVRILDVSIGTIRTIITVKGKSLIASIVGFFEIFIWFIIVREALNTDINSIWIAISYSLGFATGTYIGSFISNKFINSNCGVQIVTSNQKLIHIIRNNGFGVTVVEATHENNNQENYVLFVETTNKSIKKLKEIVNSYEDKIFMVITETKAVHNGYFK